MDADPLATGRLLKAPENFIDADGVRVVVAESRAGRRVFIRKAFAAVGSAGVVVTTPLAHAQPDSVAADGGDPNILELPAHSRGLGQPVATDGYGKPSAFERNVQRRTSPGLTPTTQASVSFAPLQSLFGIVTPSGLHFERHHQGWWDIDPSRHRLMVNGSDDTILKQPMVFTMDELMRLPTVSRFHFIECGANTGMEWGNVAVPTCQYTHGMLSCSEFTGVPLKVLLDMAGADYKRGRFEYLRHIEVGDMPSGGQVLLDKGFYNISGLAWSGRGNDKWVETCRSTGGASGAVRGSRRRCSSSAPPASTWIGCGTANRP